MLVAMSDEGYRTRAKLEPDEPDADSPWVTQTWTSRHTCPRCNQGLFAARREGIRVDACGGCGGVWLASDDAQRMLSSKSHAPSELARTAAEHARVVSIKQSAIKCLECGEELSRNVVPPHNVEIDVCATHGTWFDRSELERVVDALMPNVWRATPPPPPTIQPLPSGEVSAAELEDFARRVRGPAPAAPPPTEARYISDRSPDLASDIAREIRRQQRDEKLFADAIGGLFSLLAK